MLHLVTHMTEIGAALRARRKAMGWTLHEVAEKAGLSYSMLSHIEKGQNTTIDRVADICRALELDFVTVFRPFDQPKAMLDLTLVPEERRHVVQIVSDLLPLLSDTQLQALVAVLSLIERRDIAEEASLDLSRIPPERRKVVERLAKILPMLTQEQVETLEGVFMLAQRDDLAQD